MELIGLDASYNTVKALNCINIQWNQKYYEAGDYAIQLRAADWDMSIAYVYTKDRAGFGMVEKVEAESTIKGEIINVSGYFMEAMLNWKVVYPRYKNKGTLIDLCETALETYLPEIQFTYLHPRTITESDSCDIYGEFLGDAMYAILKKKEYSHRIVYSPTYGFTYRLWFGLNRTQSQSAFRYAVFSQNNGTVDAMTLTRDTSAMRNYARVLYDGGSFTIDLRSGSELKRVLLIDTGMVREEGQTTADFLEAVEAEARKTLAEYPEIINVEATVLQTNLKYRTDYNLGDKVTLVDDRVKMAFDTRIIGVSEVWKNGEHTISLEFGEKIPTTYKRRRV